MNIAHYFRGLYRTAFPTKEARSFLSALIYADVPFGEVKTDGETSFFYARRRDVEKIKEIADKIGIEAVFELTGFLRLLQKYRMRAGLAVGALLAAAILFVSSKFVWDIDISGDGESAAQVEQALSEHGFKLGSYLPSLDLTGICKSIVVESDNISWLSVNMHGTVAHVEYRERSTTETQSASPPSNLVAACDGQIVRIEAVGGKNEVKIGQTVKQGDVLVSGVIDSEALGFRLVRSRGEVYAAVSKTFTSSCPLEFMQKTPTGRTKEAKKIIFFSKNAKNEKIVDTTFEKYDTIEKTERVSLFGVRLPVFVNTTTLVEYEETPVTLMQEQAQARATENALSEIADVCGKSEVLSTQSRTMCENGVVTVSITVEYITNIAVEQIILTEQK